jgi:hypothetical protein
MMNVCLCCWRWHEYVVLVLVTNLDISFVCSKQNMNTWAFVGSLNDTPQLSCVYKSQDAQNEFLSNPKHGIGEDYLDDDRATGKIVKGSLTGAQKEMKKKADALPIW